MALKLVQLGLSGAAMFGPNREDSPAGSQGKGLTPLRRRAKVDRPLRRAMLTIAPPSGGHDLPASAMEEDFLSFEDLRS
jgi:hypothetical protein